MHDILCVDHPRVLDLYTLPHNIKWILWHFLYDLDKFLWYVLGIQTVLHCILISMVLPFCVLIARLSASFFRSTPIIIVWSTPIISRPAILAFPTGYCLLRASKDAGNLTIGNLATVPVIYLLGSCPFV